MHFTPYLSFQGQCADAFNAYAEIFGGTAELMRFSDAPAGNDMPPLPEDQANWVMHGRLSLPDGSTLMGADMPVEWGGKPQQGVSISVPGGTKAEAEALFNRLAEGGKVTMPFSKSFFADGFGMCRDRFGTAWMVTADH
ncbi:MAG: VOC family protein [Paracoccus sp. (in: a-proteobacteria)]|nr:VOC family protein [Paracoccus sp. (in: a-proteobacteria)]